MLGKTHLMFGAACWLGFAHVTGIAVQPAALLLATGAALLPDIDAPQSTFGQCVPFISIPVSRVFGHRGITHSLFAVAVAIYLLHRQHWDAHGFTAPIVVGYLSHMLGDFVTHRGIQLFYPLQARYCLNLWKTGGPAESLIRVGLTLVLVVGLWHAWGGALQPHGMT